MPTSQEISMTAPTIRLRFLLSMTALCGACLLALPAGAQQAAAPAPPGMVPAPPGLAEALALTPTQARLWQAARTAAREAEAHALELRAHFLRETADESPDAPLRPRAQAADQLHDALEKDRRAVREHWLALDDSLDAAQRRRLRTSPEAARWLGLPPGPGGMMGPSHGGPMR